MELHVVVVAAQITNARQILDAMHVITPQGKVGDGCTL